MNFWQTVFAASIGQIITYMIVQGFEMSYWGRNIREEVTRWFDTFCKHVQKEKK